MVIPPSSSKSNLFSSGCRERRRQQKPRPVVPGLSSMRPESGEGQSAASIPVVNTLHPLSAMSISGRKTFLCAVLTSRFPLGLSGSVCAPFWDTIPHSTFLPLEKSITKIQICSACCLHVLTVAFAIQPCGTLKALPLQHLCVWKLTFHRF